MSGPRTLTGLLRFAFYHFYNRFAFTYDVVSATVSRGDWRAWTCAAIPFVRGPRVLEVAFGTGDLHLELYKAGYQPLGVDLSPYMLSIAREKFRRAGSKPHLVRANVRQLPFPKNHFTTVVMTFPPGLAHDPAAMRELHRVLAPGCRLVWVDAPLLEPRDGWGRFLNWAFRQTGGCADPDAQAVMNEIRDTDARAFELDWSWRVEPIQLARSRVHVFIGTKKGE